MIPYLKGQWLFRFVDGSVVSPPLLPDNITPNPDFITWTETDQLIRSAIVSSFSDNLNSSCCWLLYNPRCMGLSGKTLHLSISCSCHSTALPVSHDFKGLPFGH